MLCAKIPSHLWTLLLITASLPKAYTVIAPNGLEEKLEFTIEEGVSPGTLVGRVQKRDGYTYRLNERNRFFAFNSSNGELRTLDDAGAPLLDREALERYGYKHDDVDFVILGSASSSSISPPTYFVAVTVRVLDINDNAPTFPFSFQNVSLPESARVGTRVILASATDADEGENGVIKEYQLIGGNEGGAFNLGRGGNGGDESPEAVFLELRKALDRETRALYILNVSAIDGGKQPLTGFLTIFVNVLDSNDNQPVFDRQQYSVSVSENLPAGSSILLVSATDRDNGENARISYSIGNDAENQFRINSETGVLSSNTAPLKCPEMRPTNTSNATRLCTFTIEAVDHGVPVQRGRTFVNVELFDVNDHAPEIAFRYYSAAGSGNDAEPAAIVDESKPIGTVVAVVTVTDPDHGENGKTTLSIVNGNELGHFRLESNELFSVVRTNAVLKSASVDKYTLTIMAKDRGTPPKFSTRTMPIYVNDANDQPPAFDQSIYTAKIPENSPMGSYVLSVRASGNAKKDDGCQAGVWYDFVNDTSSSGSATFFQLNHKTGLITVAGPLDYDQGSLSGRNFTLTISAKDACRPSLRSSTAVIKIDLTDTNDQAPSFAKPAYHVDIFENASIGSLILKLEAFDGDSGDNGRIKYSFADTVNSSFQTIFSLHPTTGSLSLASLLDREKLDSYKFAVVASDHGTPPLKASVTVRIRVLDVNDNAPKFLTSEYYVNLHPFDPAGTPVTKITAEDPDEGSNGEVTYFFLEQPPITAISLWPKTGELYLKSRMVWTGSANRFDIVLGAADGKGFRAFNNATVHVFVSDLGGNINSSIDLPQFTKDAYVFRVQEDAGAGPASGASKPIGSVSATDSDSPITASNPIQYKIIDGDYSNHFDIGPYSGEIRSTRKLDYEEASAYTLTVAALGKFGASVVKAKIEIEDVNDNAPRFVTNATKILLEHWYPAGFRFRTVTAVDADSGPNGLIKYSLKGDSETAKHFDIGENSGTLFLKTPARSLRRTGYTFTLIATDSGSPSLNDTITVSITVIDGGGRSRGWFPKTSYDFSIWENTAVNTRLIKLNMTRPCGQGGAVDCAIYVDGEESDDVFGVFPDGWLYVKNELDFEKRASYQLNLEARQKFGAQTERAAEETKSISVINLHLVDQNDNAPQCPSSTVHFRHSEHSPPLAYVGTVTVEDSDSGLNGFLKYRLLPDSENFASAFHIGPSSGVITALRAFDRENLLKARNSAIMSLLVEAQDFGKPESKRVQCKIEVEITDINDHAPQFALDVYAVSVPESQEAGLEILRLTATDEDELENGAVEFSIVNGDELESKFWVNSSTGQLFLIRPLDRELKDSYVLQLMVRDSGKPTRLNSTAFATIFVSDINDNAPVFQEFQNSISLSELTPVGSLVTRITATDTDAGAAGIVRYSLTKGNVGQVFELDPVTGTLTLVKPLDFESRRNYTLAIWAADQGTPSLMNVTELVVVIEDENDNAPVITSSILVTQVPETAQIGARVFILTAADLDTGVNGTVRFAIVNQKPTSAFGIEPDTGVIFVSDKLDSESTDVYNILVEATDSCEKKELRLSSRRMITILLTDETDKSAAFGGLTAILLRPEDSSWSQPGSKIANIGSVDSRNRFAYSLLAGDTDSFDLTVNGELILKKQLDLSKSVYKLKIEAAPTQRSNSTKSAPATRPYSEYTVILEPAQPALRFEKAHYDLQMIANSVNGTEIGRVGVQGNGISSRVEYYVTKVTLSPTSNFTSPETQELIVDIDRSTGVLFSTGILRRKRLRTKAFDTAVVELTAVDTAAVAPSGSKCEIIVRLQQSDQIASKFSENFYQFQISEDAPAGTMVGLVKTFGVSANTSRSRLLRYSFTNHTSIPFDINPDTGSITLSHGLDRETIAFYDFEVRADDGSASPKFASVHIDVLDVNDNEPSFDVSTGNGEPSFNFKVVEGAQRETFVGKVAAVDKDAGANGEIEYSLASPDVAAFFTLESTTGLIRVNRFIDREEYSVFFLDVIASDRGNPPKRTKTTVFIEVLDVNDNQPIMERSFYDVSVRENASVGTVLLQISALDYDTDTNFYYAIVSGNVWSQFAINRNGTLTISAPLDRETRPIYHLVVTVYDQPPNVALRRSSSAQVTVNVLDVNDHTPHFVSPNWTSITPNTVPGTVVTTIKAIDLDEGPAGSVSYLLDPNSAGTFSLDPISGDLRLNGHLPKSSSTTVYNLTIWAYDRGQPRLSSSWKFAVYVLSDTDGYKPTFEQKLLEVTVSEDMPVGKSLLKLAVSGEQQSTDAPVRFWMLEGQHDGLDFDVAPDTGIFSIARSLDFERTSSYNLTVAVSNLKLSGPSDLATILVLVKDVNDNSPTFLLSPMYFDIVEGAWTAQAVSVGIVTAVDADSGPNGKLSYSIIQGNTTLFNIDSLNGELKMQGEVDREAIASYVLTVEAADSGTPRRTSTTSVIINVLDVNDNEPIFDKPSYVGSVAENQAARMLVLQVSAMDADDGDNGFVNYKLESDYKLPFSIDELTGEIRTKASLDREFRDKYDFVVVAVDSAFGEPRSTSVHVRVAVTDENDNTPTFIDTSQDIYINTAGANGDFVYVVGAEDTDEGENARLRYALGGRDAKFFDIAADTGVIQWKAASVPSSANDFSVDVFVSDSGKPSRNASTSLRFFPKAAADFPDLSQMKFRSFSVFENQTNAELAYIFGRSPKHAPLNRITYSIASGNFGGAFALNALTGQLTTTEKLDYEFRQAYELYVAATDNDNPPLTSFTKIMVQLHDCNDNAPVFAETSYTAMVLEEEAPPLAVVRVKATDADSGSNARVRYSIKDDPIGIRDLFDIDPETGAIVAKAALDREKVSRYRIMVEAVDGGTPSLSSSVPVVVDVTDINDNAPKFTRLFAASVREDAVVGTFVTQVTSSDADSLPENTNNTYHLSVNPGEKFIIDPRSGNVSVNGPLDRESVPEYQLKVVAVDGAWRVETSLTVTILDVNDNSPKFSQGHYIFNTSELQPPLTIVGKVQAVDIDEKGPNSKVIYRLSEKSSLFIVDSQTGELRSSKVLRRQNGDSDSYTLPIIAEDSGRPIMSSTAVVTVRITNMRRRDIFSRKSVMAAMPAEMAKGAKIRKLSVADDDIVFSMEQENPEFAVDPDSGWLLSTKPLSISAGTQYKFAILAQDSVSGGTLDTLDITLVATEANKNTPEFSSPTYSVNIAENVRAGSAIFTVSARDYDQGLNGKVTYACSKNLTKGDACDWFSVDEETGVIVLKKELDYETAKSHKIVVSATDGGYESKQSFAVLMINVQDVNDNSPRFSSTKYGIMSAYVQENSPRGAPVVRLNCTDLDSAPYNAIVYSIENGTDNLFAVDPNTGLITVIGDIDFETKSVYTLRVECKNSDSVSMFDTALLTVYIDGVNEFLPKFEKSKYEFEADVTASERAVIGVVKATDEDSGLDAVIFYSAVAEDGASGLSVDELTGEIIITRRTGKNFSSVSVVAQNRKIGSPANISVTRVTVLFSQKGFGSPIFANKKIYAEVVENAAIGTVLAMANATGARRVIYELVSGNIDGAFRIDRSSGAIRVNGQLDRETMDMYTLIVKASADGYNLSFAMATVTVTVLDANDNPPYLTDSASIGYILENEPNGSTVMTLLPSDNDLPPNRGPYNFTLLRSKWSGLFELDSTTGVLRSKAVFDREVASRYTFPVKISDAGHPPLWAVSNVTIVVEDVNDQLSNPRPAQIKILSFQSTTPDKAILGSSFPDDADSTGNYECRLRTGNATGSKLLVRSNCVTTSDGPISVPSKHKLALTGTDGLHDWVDYEADVEFERGDQSWVENAVLMTARGDFGKLAQSFLTWMNGCLAKLVPTEAGKLTAKILDVAPRPNMFEQDLEMALILLYESGIPVPFAKSIQLLQSTTANTDFEFEIRDVFSGFCTDSGSNSSAACKNGGNCLELANVDPSEYHSITEGPMTLSFPKLTRSYRCNCLPEFTGAHCETVIDQCASHRCSNGASCVYQKDSARVQCICPEGYTGPTCDEDIDECKAAANPCLNGGWCENTKGSYRCLCMVGYGGPRCENSASFCASEPCLNSGKCTVKSDGYSCTCEFGFTGKNCQIGSMGFDDASYLEVKTGSIWRDGAENSLEFEFATINTYALLVYSSRSGSASGEFLTLGISGGFLKVSTSGSTNAVVGSKKPVNDGRWYKVTLAYSGTKLVLSVGECSSVDCLPCPKNDESCRAVLDGWSRSSFLGSSVFIGSVREFNEVLANAAQLSAPGFVGCVRNLKINGIGMDKLPVSNQEHILNYCPRTNQLPCSSTRTNSSCADGERCQDGWSRPVCSCQGGFSSSSCKNADDVVSFNGGGFISYKLTESYRRRLLFAGDVTQSKLGSPDDTYRFKRLATANYPKQYMILEFRTTAADGLLFFAMASSEEFSLIDIVNGSVRYMSRSKDSKPMQITLNDGPYVSDGEWHLVSLAFQSSGNEVEFRIDNFGKDARSTVRLYSIISANMTVMTVGGAADPVKISGNALKGFKGCLRKFIINGVLQPLARGDKTFFDTKIVGELKEGCDTANCPTPPCSNIPVNDGREGSRFSAGVVAVLVFFACMIASTVVAFFIVRRLKNRKCGKKAGSATSSDRAGFVNLGSTVANISTLSEIVRLRQQSECANLNGSIKDSGIVLGVSRQTLDGSQISLNNPLDVHRTATSSTLSASTYLNTYLQGDQNQNQDLDNGGRTSNHRGPKAFSSNPFVERYDLDDASSIAPSDADVAKHYRDYRHGGFGFGAEGPQRKLPSKFLPPPPPPLLDSTIPSLFGPTYASSQSLAARNRKSQGLRATPSSVLAMMPESESSDEIMMQRSLMVPGARDTTESVFKSTPDSNRSMRSRQRRNAQSGDRASARLRKSQRGSTKSRSRRRREKQEIEESDAASENSTSSSDAVTLRGSSLKASRRSTSASNNVTPRILSRTDHESPRQRSSTNEECSDTVSAATHSEFDLDQVRKPRQFLQRPEDTETESDMNSVNAQQRMSFCLDQFIPGPRTLFLMSEDDNTTDAEGESRHRNGAQTTDAGRRNGSPANRLSGTGRDGLEAYV